MVACVTVFRWFLILSYFFGMPLASFATETNDLPTQIIISNDKIEILVQAELWTEDERISEKNLLDLVPSWKEGLAKSWNLPTLEKIQDKQPYFQFEIKTRQAQPNPHYHQIEIRDGESNEYGMYQAFVVVDQDPTKAGYGVIPIQMPILTVAHEFGHLMRLKDEYAAYSQFNDIPKAILQNGQNLIPLEVQYSPWQTYFVAFGLLPTKVGMMALGNDVPMYYIKHILKTHGAR